MGESSMHPKVVDVTTSHPDLVSVTVVFTVEQAERLANPWISDTQDLIVRLKDQLKGALAVEFAVPASTPFTDQDLAHHESRHRPVRAMLDDFPRWVCSEDHQIWPCRTARWLATIDRREAGGR